MSDESFVRPMRIPSDVTVCMSVPANAKAGANGRWVLHFTLSRSVSAEERLWLCVHGGRNMKNSWSKLQAQDPDSEGYVLFSTAAGLALECEAQSDDAGTFSFKVPDEGLKEGSGIAVRLVNSVAPRYSQPEKFFLLVTAQPGEEFRPLQLFGDGLKRVVGACMLGITGGGLAEIRAFAPSSTAVGQEFGLLVRPEDTIGNVASSDLGELVVRCDGVVLPAKRVQIGGSRCCRLEGIALPKEGVYHLEVEDVSHGLKAVTNPIICGANGALLWGSMHSHTEMSDGTGTLDRYFTEMRDECAIDFGATSDHDKADETPEELWQFSQRAVEKYNEPGRFTVFLGYEWATWRKNGDGDRNVYYLKDHRPIFRSGDDAYPNPAGLLSALKDEDAIVIPHHPAHPGNHNDWKDHDPEKERLVEIYSLWGCSERSVGDGNIYLGAPVENPRGVPGVNPLGYVQRALAMGWRVGFSANADDHSGHGSDRIVRHKEGRDFTGGLTGVYAKENTREAIWDALRNRRCYATTGDRIIAEFTLNGHPMGSELDASECGKRTIKVSVHGTAPIKSIEVVRNNVDAYRIEPCTHDAEFEWTDDAPLAMVNLPAAKFCPVPFTFYYVRVTQEDNQQAWVSPIWISE